MSIIKVENLSFSYPSSYENIFDNVSFQIDTDWKLGFVGRNGRGKTTFLKLLLGEYEYSGKINTNVEFDYFPYLVNNKNRMSLDILNDVCPMAEEWELIRELSYLDVDCDVLYRDFYTLSKGEQTKILLAALFLNDGHFLLIDEPTNHLDSKGRKIVSEYLRKKKGFILVSHDRSFLDGCVDHILSINKANIDIQSGNFSSWFANFNARQKLEFEQNERLKREINRLYKSSEKSVVWSEKVEKTKIGSADKGYVGHKAAKMMKRSKAMESRKNKAIEQKSELLKNIETADNLKLKPLTYRKDILISFSDVTVFYGKNKVCSSVSFTIKNGDRVAINGTNGSGKSSLLKLLIGKPIEHSGIITIGSGLKISYVAQDTSFLVGTLQEFSKKSNIDETLFKSILRKMGFERVHLEKNINDFSEGQKKKVLIAKSLCESANIYVWDEPLNFIDIYSRMQIENLIKTFSPTMIFVEHDKAFRDSISTKQVEL